MLKKHLILLRGLKEALSGNSVKFSDYWAFSLLRTVSGCRAFRHFGDFLVKTFFRQLESKHGVICYLSGKHGNLYSYLFCFSLGCCNQRLHIAAFWLYEATTIRHQPLVHCALFKTATAGILNRADLWKPIIIKKILRYVRHFFNSDLLINTF